MKDGIKHAELNETKWDQWAVTYDDNGVLHNSLRNSQSKLVSIIDIHENVHFIDAGCGTGYAVGEAAKRVNYKGLFYGVDLSSGMIEKAKEKFSDIENFHFITANVESIPLDSEFFNIIICTNSFHHYFNPGKALNEFYRLLKKGGKIYILDPTADSILVKIADKIIKLLEPQHVKLYSTKEFKQLFYHAGFKYSTLEITKGTDKIHIGEK